MEEITKQIGNKLKYLTLSEKSLNRILEQGDLQKLEQQYKQWNEKFEELGDLEGKGKELQIDEGKDLDEISEWCNELETKMEGFRLSKVKIQQQIENIREEGRRTREKEEEKY